MNRIIRILTLAMAVLILGPLGAQERDDAQMLRKIYDKALTDGMAYDWLDHLSNEIGGRLSGSLEAEKAVRYTKAVMEEAGYYTWQ